MSSPTPLEIDVDLACLSAVERVLAVARTYLARTGSEPHRHLELEVRLGTPGHGDGAFAAQVGADPYQLVALELQRFEGWARYENRGEMVRYQYRHRGRDVRTTTFLAPPPAPQPGACPVREASARGAPSVLRREHGTKELLARATFGHPGWGSGSQNLGCRVALAVETELREDEVPAAAEPQHVRIVQRNSYVLDGWRYDLSVVWSGATRTEAEQRQMAGQGAAYEVEVECEDLPAQLASRTDRDLAAAVLRRAKSLLRLTQPARVVLKPLDGPAGGALSASDAGPRRPGPQ